MRRTAAAALFLVGCATTYAESHTDFPVRTGVHSITIHGVDDTELAKQYWHRRARELCGGDYNFDPNNVKPENGGTRNVWTGAQEYVVTGYATCGGRAAKAQETPPKP